ncbi:MAG: RdgB/HAM1 family non-canonical purine NTP pyrophosphatase [Saprospiraceae bacterium]|nr:RdgB/HAM1 family non-canonical purine NTP pyrophosphatase [Saprospiraceae bacterium]
MMRFVFATHNDHKVSEVTAILDGMDISLVSLKAIEYHDEIVEDGQTLDQNAWIKANTIYHKLGGNVIAEDTGLEVHSLDGAPGVYSARYAGPQKNAEDNIDKLLSELKEKEDRQAQFRTVVAIKIDDQSYTFEGVVKGRIAHMRTGTGGFGYDPVFIPEGYTESFGVLDPEIKNNISHRARAFEAFKRFLQMR